MKKPLQSGEPIRGRDTSSPIIADITFDGNIPIDIIQMLEDEIKGVDHGGVSLIVTIRDGNLSYRIEKIISLMPRLQRGRQ